MRGLIIDNCSSEPAAEVLAPSLTQYAGACVRIIRNKTNVGANANILRCIEYCETEWVWIVGDDDEVSPNAVETIIRHIEEHRECLLLNFPFDDKRKTGKSTRGLGQFLDALDPSADVPWIASSVYKVSALAPNLRFGYQFAYSMLPHVATLLMSFDEGQTCFFATERIAWRDRQEATTEQQTPIINLALGFPVLLDLPIALDLRRKAVKKLLVTSDSPGLPLRQLAYQLMLLTIRTKDRRNSLYYYDQACRRGYYFDTSLIQRVEILLYRLLLLLPGSLTAWAYRRVKGRDLGARTQQNRIERL